MSKKYIFITGGASGMENLLFGYLLKKVGLLVVMISIKII